MLKIKYLDIQLVDGSSILIKNHPASMTLKHFCDAVAVEVFVNRLQQYTGDPTKTERAQFETADALGVHSKSTIYRILRRTSH